MTSHIFCSNNFHPPPPVIFFPQWQAPPTVATRQQWWPVHTGGWGWDFKCWCRGLTPPPPPPDPSWIWIYMRTYKSRLTQAWETNMFKTRTVILFIINYVLYICDYRYDTIIIITWSSLDTVMLLLLLPKLSNGWYSSVVSAHWK